MKETITEGLTSARRRISQIAQPDLYRIDIEQVARELDLEGEAKKLAAAGLPLAEQTTLTAPEAKCVQRVEKARHDFVQWASARVNEANEALGRRDVTMLVNEAILADRSFQRRSGSVVTEHDTLVRDLAEHAAVRERELAEFRASNALTRPATYPEGSATFARYAVLLALIVFEGAANAWFFSQGLESGLIGGFLAAGLFAAVNLVTAFVLGKFAIPLVFHRHTAIRSLGVVAVLFAVMCMISVGLTIGHFRDALIADSPEPARAAWLAFRTAPFLLRDVMSWLLFAVSVLFAVFALFDGLSSDDRYPGYGQVARRTRQAREDYLGELYAIRKQLEDIKDEEIERLDSALQKTRAQVAESATALREKSWTRTRLEAALLDAENCLAALLKIFRDTNQLHRGTRPRPAYFEVRPELQQLAIPEFATQEDKEKLEEQQRLFERLLAAADGIRTNIEATFNAQAEKLKPLERPLRPVATLHAQK